MLRNCVNRERKICRAKYYEAKVSHLRECKPSVWWKEVKKLSGMSPASETRANTSKLLQHLGFSPGVLANYINSAFLTPMQIFEPLTHNPFDPPQANNEGHAVNMISQFSTFKKLSESNTESFNLAKRNGLKDSNFLTWTGVRCAVPSHLRIRCHEIKKDHVRSLQFKIGDKIFDPVESGD